MSDWGSFVTQAQLFDSAFDVESEERGYKIETAERMATALDLAEAGDPGWPDAFKQALSVNLVNRWANQDLRELLSDSEAAEDLRTLLLELRRSGAPQGIDAFAKGYTEFGRYRGPGDVTNLAALVLMSVDPGSYPPYRAEFTRKWAKAVGELVGKSPRARYETLLRLCDELTSEWNADAGGPRDRLDAQGVAWAVMNYDPTDAWSASERAELGVLRGETPPVELSDHLPAAPAQHEPVVWLVRPDASEALAEAWFEEGFVSLRAHLLGEVPAGATQQIVAKAVQSGYTHLDAPQRTELTKTFHAFISEMTPGDYLITLNNDVVHVGRVEGDVTHHEGKTARLRRAATWSELTYAAPDLPAPLPARLQEQGNVVRLPEVHEQVRELFSDAQPVRDDALDGVSEPPAPRQTKPPLAPVTEEVAARLYMNREHLQEIVDLLATRQQIVLQGPPGTGKTYVAKALAAHLTADPSHYRLVQFHPSYAYEDFVEGYRPSETSGQPSFRLENGPLKRLADEAGKQENWDKVFILIIDEMNRANLAKVFGELYFLLEYRSEGIHLQYARKDDGHASDLFHLPPNLFIIGTMNTSDRSIALVDSAVRRRFPFIEMHPSEEPVRSVLPAFVAANGITDRRDELLDALNTAMGEEDHDLNVGPSYLMRPEVSEPGGFERVWKYDILPLVQEHYYGTKSRADILEEFGLATLRGRLPSSSEVDEVAGAEKASGEPSDDVDGSLT